MKLLLLAILVLTFFNGIYCFFNANNDPYRKDRPPQQKIANKILLPVYEVCATEYNAPGYDLQIFRQRDTSHPSREFDCTMLCFMERMGVVNEYGLLSSKYTKYFFKQVYGEDPEKVEKAIEGCRSVKARTCRGGFNLYSCLVSYDL